MHNPIRPKANNVIITFQLDLVHAKDIEENFQDTPYVVCTDVKDFPDFTTAQRAQLSERHLAKVARLAASKGFVAHVLPVGS